MLPFKNAVITSFVSKTKDRFHEYNEEKTLPERLSMVSAMEGVTGVEVVFPYEVLDEAAAMKALVAENDLAIAAVNVNIKGEPQFRDGGLSSTDKAVRDEAISYIHRAKDYAAAVGADKVTCCPLADGYEFSFQYDYATARRNILDTLGRAADYRREIPLFVEYKPSETRGRCYLDTAAKTLCALNDIGIRELGVTLDFGHALYGNEHPAEALALLAESDFPYYLHINDNNGRWDWDYMVGTHHLLSFIEFLFYAQEYGYDDFFTSDTSPTRWDIRGTFEVNARLSDKLWKRLYAIDRDELKRRIAAGDYLHTWRFIEDELLRI
ncbi:MAG: TIM barrel protein [Rhodothermales bacterium]